MTILWISVAGITGIAVLGFIYWLILLWAYKIPLRANEVHWVKTPDLWHLRICRYRGDKPCEPVFLCHSALANQYNFSLPEGKSLVDVLVEAGYDCWVIDLRGNRSSIPPFGQRRMNVNVDDHLLRDLPASLEYIRNATGHAKVHWIGHSYGGMLMYAYQQMYGPDYIASGTTLGSPPGFRGVRFSYPSVVLFFLRLCPGLISFMLRGSVPLVTLVKPSFEFLPINWKNMNPEIGAAGLFNVLEVSPPQVGQELAFWASHDIWSMNDDKLDVVASLDKLKVPLFAIYGADDPLCPEATTQDFFDNLPNHNKKILRLSAENGHYMNYNHVDLAFSVNAVEEVFKPIEEWLGQHRFTKMPTGKRKTPVKEKAAPEKKAVAKKKATVKKKAVAKKKPVAKKAVTRKVTPQKKAPAKRKTTAKKTATTKTKASSGKSSVKG